MHKRILGSALSLGLWACGVPATTVVINEVTASGNDYIELYNASGDTIDLRGWSLTDGKPEEAGHRFTFTSSASLPTKGFFPLQRGVFRSFDFGLGDDDVVILYDQSGLIVDQADYGVGEASVSWCRTPDGTGFFKSCAAQTLGRSNAGE
ncbi:MAG: lamin tail domain-containing protein [Myxococcota bacterium]